MLTLTIENFKFSTLAPMTFGFVSVYMFQQIIEIWSKKLFLAFYLEQIP
jgi:hypothetical protein